MSNLSVLPKILKLRTINQIVISNIRLLGNSSVLKSEKLNSIENCKNYRTNDATVRQNVLNRSYSVKHNRRMIHTCSHLWKSTEDNSTKQSSIDQFRAEEVKIEREYEEQKQKENQSNAKDHTASESTEDHEKIQKVRSEILEASLKFVPTKGWSQEAIANGAESINYPGVAHGMFPNGAIELIHHFYAKCNRELITQLEREFDELTGKADDSGKAAERPSPRDFAIRAIRLRLEMIIPYKETWPQALAIMTLPQNVPTSLAQLLTLVDDVCYCAGDRSVDIGWYTRRIGIASIYKMVELYLLQDKSPNHQQTWEFLERRMDEGIQIQEFLSDSDQKTKTMANALGSAFQTARNILGINCDKR
ncbi:ubiquinone biosynthesis protein COQ9, mitochondrial [Sitodiplosis mosellana]|uniref:ubiquinone biosynthesis protein COQ9, mitochondrial n=1 Tax=Sitodiplosis mosellana TaxID=263140 RepID=UPI0024446EE9|nr:ubiquinone biosynthesis protein COQ9, mitochondrial [Sitodiplosis mosellana]